jgi:hypothetical protein
MNIKNPNPDRQEEKTHHENMKNTKKRKFALKREVLSILRNFAVFKFDPCSPDDFLPETLRISGPLSPST